MENDAELQNVLHILQKRNFKETEEHLRRELNRHMCNQQDPNYDSDALFYYDTYETLLKFVDSVQKDYKHELAQVLYPIFLHFYLELINKNQTRLASEFYEKFASYQVNYHTIDLKQLKLITTKDQLDRSDFKDTIGSGKYNIKLCEDSYRLLKDFVKMRNFKRLVDIIKNNMLLEIYNGQPRYQKQQLIYVGGILGETNSNNNVEKMFYGRLKENDFSLQLDENDDQVLEDDVTSANNQEKPKRKKKKDSQTNKKNKVDPNAPPLNRMPLPEQREIDRLNRLQAHKDYLKRARLSPDKLPSVCFYTILNSYNSLNCCDLSDDSQLLAIGLNDSSVRVYSLLQDKKLKSMKQLGELENLDKESDDIFNLMLDDSTASDFKVLIGHSGPVFSVCISHDKYNLVSGSEDGTIRLWCLLTFSCLVCYKGHNGPVWDVKFGPFNHYFASCGADKSARLWTIDSYQSLRIYADHLSDVDCLCFHPNCNYLATGCSDRSIRIYDLPSISESSVIRHLTGHKDTINILKFSHCGRYLASGGQDCQVLLWDVATPIIIAQFDTHKGPIYSLDFSRDNVVLATGGLDNTIKCWFIAKLTKEIEQSEDPTTFSIKFDQSYEISSFKTKLTPIIGLQFTRKNLLLGVGPFQQES